MFEPKKSIPKHLESLDFKSVTNGRPSLNAVLTPGNASGYTPSHQGSPMGSYYPGPHLKSVNIKSHQRQYSKKVIIKVKPDKMEKVPSIPLDTMKDLMVRNSTTFVKPWMTDRSESPVIEP